MLVPTRSRARVLQLARAAAELAAGNLVWPSAQVLTPSAWSAREAARALAPGAAAAGQPRLLSAAEEWYLWRACTRDETHNRPLLDRGAVAESLERAATLARDWEVAASGPQPAEAALFVATRRAFDERCRALNALPAAALAAQGSASAGRVRLAGFTLLPPRLARLGVHSAHAAARAAALLVVSDRDEECARIGAWCEERLRVRPDARLLVLMPGVGGRLARLAGLIRQGLDPRGAFDGNGAAAGWVGTDMAQSLAAQPLIAHALRTLGFLAGGELDTETLGSWLRAPFWTRPPAPERARIALALRDAGIAAATLTQFLGALQRMPPALSGAARELAAVLTRARGALRDTRAPARSWAERCRAALEACTWPGSDCSRPQAQQLLLAWHELLEELGELTQCAGSLERASALELLGELARHGSARGVEEDVSVTLASSLFDPIVHYDGIWVAGLDAQSFPLPASPDPFLPLPAQRAAGIPAASATGRLREARALLAAWQGCTHELVLSAPLRDEDLELLPSPLFSAVERAPGRLTAWLAQAVRRDGLTEAFVDDRGVSWRTNAPLPRGTRTVELQNLCPFRAYAELRLGSARPERVEPGIPANQRGLLLHAALEYLWQRLGDSAMLRQLSSGELSECIAQSVARARDELLAPPPPGRRRARAGQGQLDMFASVPPILARECARAQRLITRLCELEKRRPPFRVAQTEHTTELALGGARLRLRIDRVDALEQGGHAVLDYKTGKHIVPDWQEERPAHTQLLVYSCALPEDVAALATVTLNVHEVRFDGITREPRTLPDVAALPAGAAPPGQTWRAQQGEWRALIERLIRAFVAGEASVDPRPGACTFCHVTDICRITEAPAGAGEDLPEGGAHE